MSLNGVLGVAAQVRPLAGGKLLKSTCGVKGAVAMNADEERLTEPLS